MKVSGQSFLKGSLSVIILSLLDHHERMYGYEITQKVKAMTVGEMTVTEGALYPALHKLEAEGLLTTETQVVDGRVRKYYSLTRDGHAQASSRVDELAAFIQNLQVLLTPKPALS